jgi:hypothetical protein
MSGRIKLLKEGVPIQETHLPELPYEYDMPSDFDKQCGTLVSMPFSSRMRSASKHLCVTYPPKTLHFRILANA